MDLYPEYTGTGWLLVLKNEETDDADYIFTSSISNTTKIMI